jgi:hypothetical protein
MLRRVALVRTDVSEDLSASIVRVTRIGELGTTLAVTSNRRKQQQGQAGTHLIRNGCACFPNRPSKVNIPYILAQFSQCPIGIVEVKDCNIGLWEISGENIAVLPKLVIGTQNAVPCL